MISTRPAFSVASLAERWSCSTGLVRKLIKSGKVHAFNYGKLIRISADEVDRYEGNPLPAAMGAAREPVERVPKPASEPTMVRVPNRGWPEAMSRSTAAAYCDISAHSLLAEVGRGRLPRPFTLGGREHWHKEAIDKALRVLGGETTVNEWADLE